MKRWIFLSILVIGLISTITLAISGWFERNPVAGGILGATLFFAVLVGLAGVMFYLGAAWTERQVRLGATIATSAQQIDQRTDTALRRTCERETVALTQLAREMLRLSRQGDTSAVRNQTMPSLPRPMEWDEDSEPTWLAPLTPFNEAKRHNNFNREAYVPLQEE